MSGSDLILKVNMDFPEGLVVKNLSANEADTGLSPGPGRFHIPGATEPMCHSY